MLRRRVLNLGLGLAGAAMVALAAKSSDAQLGGASAAPEFVGLDGWINTSSPVTVSNLRSKVVLVDFWTYSCINCRRTVPYLNRWQAEYGPMGLQVVGIHTPEFGFERARPNVEDSVRDFGILYPVGQDNNFQTWRAWNNRAWPAFYLLDRDGHVVLLREGEGYAREMEGAIRGLLGLARSGGVWRPSDDPDLSRIRTPEMYFGVTHRTPQDRAQLPRRGKAGYAFTNTGTMPNTYQLDGEWSREDEKLVLNSSRGRLRLRFSAAKLHLVAAAAETVALRIRVDGSDLPPVDVSRPTLYTLLDGENYGEHLLEVEANKPGLALFSATFG
jgi:thiol-disulfide isomerase/thioredoxin